MKSSIYYFSGTGNSYYIAKKVAQEITGSIIMSIVDKLNLNMDDDSDFIGIVYPVYFQDTPIIIKNFINKIRPKKEAFIYIIVNANGLPSRSLKNADKEFKKKNHHLNAAYYLDMPGNSIVALDFSNSEEIRRYRLSLADQHIKHIVPLILKRFDYRDLIKGSNPYIKSVFEKWLLTYLVKDKMFYTNDNCTLCSECKKICPLKNIEVAKGKIKWNGNCVHCWGCLNRCPRNAIENMSTKNRPRYKNPMLDKREYY